LSNGFKSQTDLGEGKVGDLPLTEILLDLFLPETMQAPTKEGWRWEGAEERAKDDPCS
jgi:hypothetical protein